jgi:hypothetical protein
MSENNIDNRIGKIEKHLSNVEKEILQLTSLQNDFIKNKVVLTDKIWNCSKCGSRLGIYDLKKDELRVRYRDLLLYLNVGVGGYLKLVCKSCSHINELNYEH